MTTERQAQVSAAAKMAGEWWAERLHPDHADKRKAFAQAVSERVASELRGEVYWSWGEGRKDGNREPRESVFTECDYDPQGLLLEAVREVIDPECRGCFFSARGILPEKHSLRVKLDRLEPKEGYGRWTSDIAVPQGAQ